MFSQIVKERLKLDELTNLVETWNFENGDLSKILARTIAQQLSSDDFMWNATYTTIATIANPSYLYTITVTQAYGRPHRCVHVFDKHMNYLGFIDILPTKYQQVIIRGYQDCEYMKYSKFKPFSWNDIEIHEMQTPVPLTDYTEQEYDLMNATLY